MENESIPRLVVKGRNNVIIAGTNNFYGKQAARCKKPICQPMQLKIKYLRRIIREKDRQIRDRDKLIQALLERV
jgi:hypothetical protein